MPCCILMLDLGLYFVDVENQSLLASSLQTAYNLRALPSLVQRLLRDLCDAIEERIRNAFDLSLISKEFISKGMESHKYFLSLLMVSRSESAPSSQGLLYKSRVRTEPTNITAPQWTAALWARLETLIEEMATCCIKVAISNICSPLRRLIVTPFRCILSRRC